MHWLFPLLLAAVLPHLPARAQPMAPCAEAAAEAERRWSLPPGLIAAVGRVESGRADPATGQVTAWPWTVNADGTGHYFASLAEAAAFVRALQARGVRLIDAGCFQVDLFYHPAAFASIEQAFDPAANADYAGRFLVALHARTGSWAGAIAGYHSGMPQEGDGYRQHVMAQWAGGGQKPAIPTMAAPGALIHGGGVAQGAGTDPYVVLMSAAARAIPVFYGQAFYGQAFSRQVFVRRGGAFGIQRPILPLFGQP